MKTDSSPGWLKSANAASRVSEAKADLPQLPSKAAAELLPEGMEGKQ